jgi:proteasome activator subunit 4
MDVASAALQSPSEAATPSPEQAAEPAFDALAAYLRSVPYDCESPETMQEKLDGILAKVAICAASKDWKGLSSWFAMLQWYVPKGHHQS